MKHFYRFIRRKRNIRRLLAVGFVLIAFIEIGSHAFSDSKEFAHFDTLGFCGIAHDRPTAVDVPTKQRPRGPESNLLDEMTTHVMIMNDLVIPRAGVSYWTDEDVISLVRPLIGNPTAPFHPPKQA